LGVDPGERSDVAAEHPDIVAALTARADAHRRTVEQRPPLFDALLPAETL
jgi:hypothetical protein